MSLAANWILKLYCNLSGSTSFSSKVSYTNTQGTLEKNAFFSAIPFLQIFRKERSMASGWLRTQTLLAFCKYLPVAQREAGADRSCQRTEGIICQPTSMPFFWSTQMSVVCHKLPPTMLYAEEIEISKVKK